MKYLSGKHLPAVWLSGKTALLAAVLLGVSVVVAGVSGLFADVAVAVSGPRGTVSSAGELRQAVEAAANGAVIRLAPGRYPSIDLTNISKSGNITIMSADPARPAVVGELLIRNCSGLTLQNLEFAGQPPQPSPEASPVFSSEGRADRAAKPEQGPGGRGGGGFVFVVTGSQNIVLDNLDVHGPRSDPEAGSGLRPLLVRGSRNVTVSNSRFSHMWHGLEMLDVDGFHAIGNDFSNMRTDGIRGGNSSNIEIAYNVMTDFFPAPGDHPDGIQLWALPRTTTMDNIAIHDNLVVRGRGASTQGIFIRDVRNKFAFRNMTIRRNLIMGGLGNGIAVNSADGALIDDNQVINYPDRRASWIRIDTSRQVVMRDNRASKFMVNRSEVKDEKNKITQLTRIDEPSLVAKWLDAQPGRRRPNSALRTRMTKDVR